MKFGQGLLSELDLFVPFTLFNTFRNNMSLTRASKSSTSRFMGGADGNPGTQNRAKSLQLVPIHGATDRNHQEMDTLASRAWASKIKDVTSRLSRQTISSSLKRVNSEQRVQEGDRNSQFWSAMAYCSNEYQKKFISQAPHLTKDRNVSASNHSCGSGGPKRMICPPDWSNNAQPKTQSAQVTAGKERTSCGSLPSLIPHRQSGYRS